MNKIFFLEHTVNGAVRSRGAYSTRNNALKALREKLAQRIPMHADVIARNWDAKIPVNLFAIEDITAFFKDYKPTKISYKVDNGEYGHTNMVNVSFNVIEMVVDGGNV